MKGKRLYGVIKNRRLLLFVVFGVVGFFFLIDGLYRVLFRDTLNGFDVNFLGNLGSYISGITGTIFTIIATVLVYLTYQSQKEELKSQKQELIDTKKHIERQNFESTFFKLLELYKNSISRLKSPKYEGVQVLENCDTLYGSVKCTDVYESTNFKSISKNFIQICEYIIFAPKTIDQFFYLEILLNDLTIAEAKIIISVMTYNKGSLYEENEEWKIVDWNVPKSIPFLLLNFVKENRKEEDTLTNKPEIKQELYEKFTQQYIH